MLQVLQPCMNDLQGAMGCLADALSGASLDHSLSGAHKEPGNPTDTPEGRAHKNKTALYIEVALHIRGLAVSLEHHPMEAWLASRARPMQQAAATRQLWERLLSSLAQGKLGSDSGADTSAAASASRAAEVALAPPVGGLYASRGSGGGPALQGAIGQIWAGVGRAINMRPSEDGKAVDQRAEADKGNKTDHDSGSVHPSGYTGAGLFHHREEDGLSDVASASEVGSEMGHGDAESVDEEDLDQLRFKSIFQV